jgi:hypothetical protein
MKVKDDGYCSIWDDKSRKIMFFTHKCKIQLFGTSTTYANKVNNITIKESGSISQSSLYYNFTFIKFVLCVDDERDEYEINVAVEDK